MPVDVDATWINAPTNADPPEYDASELRLADAALLTGNGDPLNPRGGIVPHGDDSLAVTVDGADQVTVQPGAAVMSGFGGVWRTALPAAHSEALTARHATWGRIDLVVFRILDPDAVGTHTERTGRVEVIAGVPSAAPAVPELPTLAVELGRITVPASGGGSATVDSTSRRYTAAAGGLLLVPTASQLPATSSPGLLARALDTGLLHEHTSEGWAPLFRCGNTGALTVTAADTEHTHVVSFNPPMPAAPSSVQVTAILGGINNPVDLAVDAVTKNGFTLRYRRTNTSNIAGVYWHAIP